jgi:hypothetical protein
LKSALRQEDLDALPPDRRGLTLKDILRQATDAFEHWRYGFDHKELIYGGGAVLPAVEKYIEEILPWTNAGTIRIRSMSRPDRRCIVAGLRR